MFWMEGLTEDSGSCVEEGLRTEGKGLQLTSITDWPREECGNERECLTMLSAGPPAPTGEPSRYISVCGLTFQVLHFSSWQQSLIFQGKCCII